MFSMFISGFSGKRLYAITCSHFSITLLLLFIMHLRFLYQLVFAIVLIICCTISCTLSYTSIYFPHTIFVTPLSRYDSRLFQLL